jgi:hypothetical protein
VSLDKQDSCVDVQHKRRGRPRLKDTAPLSAPSAPNAKVLQNELSGRTSYHNHHDARKAPTQHRAASSASYGAREPPRRGRHENNRSLSHGSQSLTHRHHPYALPNAPPTSAAYRNVGASSNAPSYFDIPPHSPVRPPYVVAPYSPQLKPPSYYPHPTSAPPHSTKFPELRHHPYPSSPPRNLANGHPPRSEPRLPNMEASPNLLRRGSFPSAFHQSEGGQLSLRRPPIHRTGSSPETERDHAAAEVTQDSVRLPSLRDLGVPFR